MSNRHIPNYHELRLEQRVRKLEIKNDDLRRQLHESERQKQALAESVVVLKERLEKLNIELMRKSAEASEADEKPKAS